jgi:hypothetical protein
MGLALTNTLAYYGSESFTAVMCFKVLTPAIKVLKVYLFIIVTSIYHKQANFGATTLVKMTLNAMTVSMTTIN